MFYGGHMWGNGWWMFLFWVIIIALTLWALRTLRNNPQEPQNSSRSAQEIVKEHYARGEISREEYLELLEDLNDDQQV